ncbi:WxcM-like domain-containing protein [Chryseobacterium antibioticum]|uniref:WxcM-like domain-containing protein n=1 Tax=Chryseobacterium pyrolae TaxID=2987481 RepID=A0ABT2ILK4_9FLAO|nr:WxcM-like domain-containing protein [Chryseobacterium pyrolae]MCT2409540.1 WxcM-like domain-containing protein [Chryseobacterium pyrolae]
MILKGSKFKDDRGALKFNNDFDVSSIKRIYTIENENLSFIRGWQGHKIEQRWFACMNGKFKIGVIEIDNFDSPSNQLCPKYFELTADVLDILHVPAGYITSIKALEEESKLLVMADYKLDEIQDEYRFPLDYFSN